MPLRWLFQPLSTNEDSPRLMSLEKYKSKSWLPGPVEFTDEELADIRRVQTEFSQWQLKIAERFGHPLMGGPFTFTVEESE